MLKLITLLFATFWMIYPYIAEAQGTNPVNSIIAPANTMVNEVMSGSGLTAAPSIGAIIVIIIQAALSVLALIFIILIIISGFRWMTAGGNDETITKAQTTIKNALIGMIITMLAWAITYLVFNLLPFGPSQATITAS